jgi:tetratricopeptide (TPR) repeat protein
MFPNAAFLPLLALLALIFPPPSSAACENWVARLDSVQGRAEMQEGESQPWRPIAPGQPFCPGARLRTPPHSRATVRLSNRTLFSVDQNSEVAFAGAVADNPPLIKLFKGDLFAFSHTPNPLISTDLRNSEFVVATNKEGSRVSVIAGEIEVSNSGGRIYVTEGQSAVSDGREAPRLDLAIKPEDAVQWSLYFPPLVDFHALRNEFPGTPAVSEALDRYAQGDAAGALESLDRVPEIERNAGALVLKAELLLNLGRTDEAESLLAAYAGKPAAPVDALRALIALAGNRKADALALADAAVRTDPRYAMAWVVKSYALQANFDLPGALASIDRAAALDGASALIQARRAELLASLGRWPEARKAAERAARLDPRDARPLIVEGFARLRDMDTAAALVGFRAAVGADSGDPLAHFGLGLALIRDGRIPEGTEAIETAASLDPGNALIRSYLGKAYYEGKRGKAAERQFALAEKLDSRDPTPWFYDAIRKQTENRPAEALRDLQKAMALNGNRAVYRSRQALDEDLAARGAVLGRIYRELGFQPRALVEGWKAVAEDPTDYTAHRLLSDTYSALPRHDLARTSELLQSQLLQPVNITPVQPRLAESGIFLLGGLGPADVSLNEFNPLFQRNRFSLLSSGLVGSNDTYGDEVVHSGLWDKLSYSLGQFHYQTRGFRKNSDVDIDLYNAFVQGRATPWLNLQAEYRHREAESGNLDSLFVPTSFQQFFLDNYRRREATDTYRFGAHANPTGRSDLLGSFSYLEQAMSTGIAPSFSHTRNRGYTGEMQHIYRGDRVRTVVGGGYSRWRSAETYLDFQVEQGGGYLYSYARYPASVAWTLGLGTEIFDHGLQSGTERKVSPKLGLLWSLGPDTLFRAAAFKILKRSFLAGQTLEPTQVAGFNQLFDDLDGTWATRLGLGLDHRFGATLVGGGEASKRSLAVPTMGLGTLDWKESTYRAYLLWTPHPRWTATLEYFREDFANLDRFGPLDTHTQTVPATLAYFDPSGLFAKFRATYFDQAVDYSAGPASGRTEFLDLSLGYRLPKRYGIFEVQFQNLLDRNYRYEGLQNRTAGRSDGVPGFLPFSPEFTVFARLTLAL